MRPGAWIALLLAAVPAAADDLDAPSILRTIRYHPEGEPARAGLRVLARGGEREWQALASIVSEFRETEPELSRHAARALVDGTEAERLSIATRAYKTNHDAVLRALLAEGLAYGYPAHEAILMKHLRENRRGAVDVLRILAPEALGIAELRELIATPDLAPVCYDALRGRGLPVKPEELLPWARTIARASLGRAACRAWAERGDFTIYEAVALALPDGDDAVRDGAHCLLLTLSGKDLAADTLIWRSWIAARRERYEPPPPLSAGELRAAVVRGARFLKADLLDDGAAPWSADPHRHWLAGSTAMAVLGLRAAGAPADDPAIRKAVRSTLLVFDRRGRPGLPAFPARGYETYQYAVLAMALCEVDPAAYAVPLRALHKRLVNGMHENGMWGYKCVGPTDDAKPGRPDNSITQYAVLALRALQRHGFEIRPEAWKAIGKNLESTVNGQGGWNYHPGFGGRQVSMTAAGISSLAIAYEGLFPKTAAGRIAKSATMSRARAYLGRLLLTHDFAGEDLYAYYGVERAMILTGTTEFRSEHRRYDWYRRGAKRLLAAQHDGGHWGRPNRSIHVGQSWGRVIDTAYAILFLTRATRTIGDARGEGVVAVVVPGEKPEPPPPPIEPEPPSPPAPPHLHLDPFGTRDGSATLRGRTGPGTTLLLDGKPVDLDARGGFRIAVARPGTLELVAKARGVETRRRVPVRIDTTPPTLRLDGPGQRHVGKQVITFRASEPLRSLRVGGYTFPADGTVVRAAVDVREGERSHRVEFTDLAGNEGRATVETAAVNRALSLDGASALGVDLRAYPARFTIECRARGAPGTGSSTLLGNTESSGFGIFWWRRGQPLPHVIVHDGNTYATVDSKRARNDWTHYAACFDGSRVRFFVDGRLRGEAPCARHRPGRRLYVGAEPNRHNSPVSFFAGELDEVRVSSVVRYEKDFRPERTFMRDRHTLLLLHFDRLPGLDDSGLHHHMDPHGRPALVPAGEDVRPAAAAALRPRLPAPDPPALTEAEHAAQNAAAREAARVLQMTGVRVRIARPRGVPAAGVEVRALHEGFDLAAEPAVTDGRGEAVVRLPAGPWRLDMVTHEPKAGSIVFARVRQDVGAGPVYVLLDEEREIRFRGELGESRAAHAVTLAWPDLSFHRVVEVRQGQFRIRTAGDTPMLLQAVRRPAANDPGYVIHRKIGPGRTIVVPDTGGTLHTFPARRVKSIRVAYDNVGPLPLPLSFETDSKRQVLFDGLKRVVLDLRVALTAGDYAFYPRPVELDGEERIFTALPPFEASVGYVHNHDHRYRDARHGLSLRIFLLTKNGLMLRPGGAYTASWEQVLDGEVLAEGTASPPAAMRTPPVDPKRIGDIRYRLHIRGPHDNRRLEVAGHPQSAMASGGEIRTPCFPEVLPNANLWCEAVSRGARAYEETCPNRRNFTHIDRSIHMPGRLAGMGGGGGDRGWMWLPEGSVYGFTGEWYWTGLLCHELGHVYGYGHGDPRQARIMRQAGRRAGRRLWAIRPGMRRIPEGNRFRPLLEAVTRGETTVVQDFDDARDIPILRKTAEGHDAGDGILTPNLEITGDDSVFTWCFRSLYGEKVDAERRRHAAAWSWLLTLDGYSDDEIQVALYSFAAKTSLAWLARMRGTMVQDKRIDAALTRLRAGGAPGHRERGRVIGKWRSMRYAGTDVRAKEAEMAAELGHRWWRFFARREMARELFARRAFDEAEAMLVRALLEARMGGEDTLTQTLRECARIWAAR